MASLQCSKCGQGIHYHSLPQDIEYIYFSKMVWESICSTRFDKNNKEMDESGIYPKLYRSSTIENDYLGKYIKIWKCPTCGTLHVFSSEGSVKNVFIKDNGAITYDCIEEGVMFGDYLWNDITDQDISNDKLLSIEPSFYVKRSPDYLVISSTVDFSKPECYKLHIPEWMKE